MGAGVVPGYLGNAHPSIAPYEVFAAADRSMILAVGNDAQFARLVDVLGCPELATEPRFATNAARVAHRAELKAALEAGTRRRRRPTPGRSDSRRPACRAVRSTTSRRDSSWRSASAWLRSWRSTTPVAMSRSSRWPIRCPYAALPSQYRSAPPAGRRGPGCRARPARSERGSRVTAERRVTAQDAVLVALRRTSSPGCSGRATRSCRSLLAERYGVSRVPLREALKTLESRGPGRLPPASRLLRRRAQRRRPAGGVPAAGTARGRGHSRRRALLRRRRRGRARRTAARGRRRGGREATSSR